jgi:Protein of unknown function (DUF5663)
MIRIDANYLEELGLGSLPPQEVDILLRHTYETLEARVGLILANQMTEQQLDEFNVYFDAKDDAGAFRWLEQNFPNYKDIVAHEFEVLTNEVRQSVPAILALAGLPS